MGGSGQAQAQSTQCRCKTERGKGMLHACVCASLWAGRPYLRVLIPLPAPARATHKGVTEPVQRFGQGVMGAFAFAAHNGHGGCHPRGKLGAGGDAVNLYPHGNTLVPTQIGRA